MDDIDMNKPLISIIVPVYNVEKYLETCIESLLKQDYKNIEIILVDDGSKDNSGSLCDHYANYYGNIRVVHKENAGLGFARNSGLDVISGEYVTFVDSDDWVSSDLVLHLYEAMVKNEVDFCKAGFKRVKHNGEVVSVSQYDNKTYPNEAAAKELLPHMIGSSPDKHDSLEMCVCGVLYNAAIINNNHIRFPSERELISEDLVFNIDYMQFAKGACTIDALDYYYRVNEVSLTQGYRKDRIEASLFFYKVMKNKLIGLGYGKDTLLRLSRMLFIYIYMSIIQEASKISHNSMRISKRNIKCICAYDTVKEVITEYPIHRLGVKQQLFLSLIKHKRSFLLYLFANATVFLRG